MSDKESLANYMGKFDQMMDKAMASKAVATKNNERAIVRNAARCRRCNTVVESKFVHDFVSCKCEAIFVDGGTDYLRAGGDSEDFESLAEWGQD